MKPTTRIKLLEALDIASIPFCCLFAIASSQKGDSAYKINRKMEDSIGIFSSMYAESSDRKKASFSSIINKLKKEGLVETGNNPLKRERNISITKKGKEYLKNNALSLSEEKYKNLNKESGDWKIISFDIPERLRKKRAWLREVLKNLGFKPAQQSMWLGRSKIPKELLVEIRKFGLSDYVEIMGVTRKGTADWLMEK